MRFEDTALGPRCPALPVVVYSSNHVRWAVPVYTVPAAVFTLTHSQECEWLLIFFLSQVTYSQPHKD